MERILRSLFINKKTFLTLSGTISLLILFTACLNPTGIDTSAIEYQGRVLVRDMHFEPCTCCPPYRQIRGGNQIIYGLCPNRYYMIERTRGEAIVGRYFVNRNGILVTNIGEIGRVPSQIISGWMHGVTGLIGLSNEEHGYIYQVRHALPLTGWVRYSCIAAQVPRDNNVHGQLGMRQPTSQNNLNLSPSGHEYTALRVGDSYDIVSVLVPDNTTAPVNRIDMATFILPLEGTHAGPTAVDYVFASSDRSNFRVLRVIPFFPVQLTIVPQPFSIPDQSPELIDTPVIDPIPRGNLGTLNPAISIHIANYTLFDINRLEWRDDLGTLPHDAAGTLILDFTNPIIRNRFNVVGYHVFTLMTWRGGRPWGASVTLEITY